MKMFLYKLGTQNKLFEHKLVVEKHSYNYILIFIRLKYTYKCSIFDI